MSLNELLQFPKGWIITSIQLNFNNEDWEVTAWDELWTGHAVMQCGATLEQALSACERAIEAEDYWAPHAERSRLATAASDILSLMGIGKAKPQALVKRRVIS